MWNCGEYAIFRNEEKKMVMKFIYSVQLKNNNDNKQFWKK